MKIGACWKKQTRDGKEFYSCLIDLPTLENFNFAMFPNENKKSDNHPDFDIVWNRKQDKDDNPF